MEKESSPSGVDSQRRGQRVSKRKKQPPGAWGCFETTRGTSAARTRTRTARHTVHAKVDQRVCLVVMLQPLIRGCVLRVGREIALEQQPHGIAFEAEQRLHPWARTRGL